MKRYNIIYYVLFLAVTMGAFASMAQNSYGMKLIGYACAGFGLTFLYELILVKRRADEEEAGKLLSYAELAAMSILALLFYFRSNLIEIPFGRELILSTLIAILIITLYHGWVFTRRALGIHKLLALGVIFYYGALAFFTITFLTGILQPAAAKTLGPSGFICLTGFLIVGILFRSHIHEGEKVSVLKFIRKMKNKSGLLLIGFAMMFLFFGLNQADILPPLYSGEMPAGYLNLIRSAESGQERTEGKKKYELFGEEYEKFVKKLNQE